MRRIAAVAAGVLGFALIGCTEEGDGDPTPDAPAVDAAAVDGPAPDAALADGTVADGPVADGPVTDGPVGDGPAPDGPPGVPAACSTGGNVVYLNGTEDDWIHPGEDTITSAYFDGWADGLSGVRVYANPYDPAQGHDWTLEFRSPAGSDLVVGVYEDAERAAVASPGHPGLDVSGDGRGCNSLTGRFEVYALERAADGTLLSFIGSFEQHCGGSTALLEGCVVFAQGPDVIDAGPPPPTPDAMPTYTLTVTVTGDGNLSSVPSGIDCPFDCDHAYSAGQAVTLYPNPFPGQMFVGWSGACAGTLPCSVVMDADRTVTATYAPIPAPSLAWARSFGADAVDHAFDVAADSTGDLIVAGAFYGTVDFGGTTRSSPPGAQDLYVARYDGAAGALEWVVTASGSATPWSVAVGPTGDVVVAGEFRGTIDVGGASLASAGEGDLFVARLAGATGTAMWARRFGGGGTESARAVAVDASGSAVIVGSVQLGTIDIGGTTVAGSFVAKLAGVDGAVVWARSMTPSGEGRDVALMPAGDVVTVANGPAMLLGRYAAADGAEVWTRAVGAGGQPQGNAVAVDGAGAIFIAGNFFGAIDFGGTTLTSMGGHDIFLARYAGAGGALTWTHQITSGGDELGRALAIDGAGDLVFAGVHRTWLNIDEYELPYTSGADWFVGRFSAVDASVISLFGAGGSGDDWPWAVTVTPAGAVGVVGSHGGGYSVGGFAMPADPGGSDAFILKWVP